MRLSDELSVALMEQTATQGGAAADLVEQIINTSEDDVPYRTFDIRTADTDGPRLPYGLRVSDRDLASDLVSEMYRRRGYQASAATAHPKRRTFVVKDGISVVGTLTINIAAKDNALKVEECFRNEVEALRNKGLRMCEYTRLAMSAQGQSPRVLAALFHVAHIFAYRREGVDRLLIEVNPRHVRYYRSMLGFQTVGDAEQAVHNPRVGAPAVLLGLDLAFAQRQIDNFRQGRAIEGLTRSIYPYSFSEEEEQGIFERLSEQDHSVAKVMERVNVAGMSRMRRCEGVFLH